MFVLGLILILLAAALLLGAMVGGADDRATFDMGSLNMSMSTTVVFLLGALTLLMLILGLALMRSAARRAAQRRKEAKELSRLSAKLEEREAELRRDEHRTGGDTTRTDGEKL
jgi:membrane protein implicated in regulation of membrane protease activity